MYDNTAAQKPLDFASPIMEMPLGKHKGKVMWTIGMNSLSHYHTYLLLTRRGKETIYDAMEMGIHEGEYAVMRNFRGSDWHCKLQGFYTSKSIAESHCNLGDGYEDFVYHIKQ